MSAIAADAFGPHAHLGRGLLAADVEDLGAGPGRAGGDVEQQRRLADARLARDEHDRAGHEAAAEHAVELGDPGGPGGGARQVDVGDALGRA